jgi:hypothetical protein
MAHNPETMGTTDDVALGDSIIGGAERLGCQVEAEDVVLS